MKPKHLFTLQAHKGAITLVKINKNIIYASSTDGSISLTDIKEKEFKQRISTQSPINSFILDPFIVATDNSLLLYDLNFNVQASIVSKSSFTSLAFLQPYFALAGCDDGSARLVDSRSLIELAILRGHSAPVLSVAASNTHFFTGGHDAKIIKWDQFGTAIQTMQVKSPVSGLVISKNNQFLLASTVGGGIWLINIQQSFQLVKKWGAGGDKYLQNSLFFTINNSQKVICGSNNKVQFIDVKYGTIQEFEDLDVENQAIFSCDCNGTHLVIGGESCRLGVYEFE
ncbi:WD40 repeat protein [Spironucleus salmonicida]|uniref:WD40 domain-containing protein n=1 Tax=Spironucleus salmonicida TaxID=348837 RepID=V6LQV6_9EUKA|nr:WD40 repeat protein [Spironucleus salmonicida]|eukprot:EST46086.1 WD40 domain-containing protein [Spironucleus salmonicida]